MEEKEREKRVKKKRKKKKSRRFFRFLILVISFAVIALAAFTVTVKTVKPDFDFKTLIPDKAYSLYNEKIMGNTTAEAETTQSTSVITTESTLPLGYYQPHKEFSFDFDKKGNLVGNVLNGGNAWHDNTYIYHIINGYGIYRFFPGTEEDVKLYSSSDALSSLNLNESNLYFVNGKNHNLYKMNKNVSTPKVIAKGVKTAYLYGKTFYIVTNDNSIATLNTEKEKLKIIRKVDCTDINFIGISKQFIYCEVVFDNRVSYVCIDKKGKTHAVDFRLEENRGELLKSVMEDGFLYYYKKSGSSEYDLCRQKFGSDKVVTIIKNADTSSYPAVENNRLFYSSKSSGSYQMREYNMNNKSDKLLLSVKSNDENLSFCHGGTYDFVFTKGSKKVYATSCVKTSSSNVMQFKDGAWKY